MSVVTQIIITFPPLYYKGDKLPIADILKDFTDKIETSPFMELHRVGGNKNLQCEFFIGSFNYFDAGLFMIYLNRIRGMLLNTHNEEDWNAGQIMIIHDYDEGENNWRVYKAKEVTKDHFYHEL